MDEERSVNNVNQNNLEKIKHKKDKRSKKSAEGIEEAHNVDSMKATESARMSEKEGTSGVNRDHKRDKEKKKKKKIKGAGNAEADMKNGSREGELTLVFGENGGGLEMDNAERNGENCSGLTVDNAGRKRKKREKKKSKKFEMHDTEEAKWGESISEPDSGSVSGKESGKEVKEAKKKRKMKRTDIKDGEDIGAHGENCLVNATEMRKKRKKDERKSKDDNTVGLVQQKKSPEKVEDHTPLANEDGNAKTNHEGKKKKKHKSKENYNDDLAATQQEYTDNDTNSLLNTNETQNSEAECTNKRKKKKTKILKNGSDDRRDIEAESANKGKKRKPSLVVNGSDGTSPNKSSKKVRFSDQDEVFPLPSNSDTEGHDKEDNLVRGKRFTQEEDELVKDAVLKYIEEHALGDEGLDMVLSCRKHNELRGCWKEIASAIPYRPYIAVYCRARILFMRSQNRKWTQEEYDMIKKYQEEHGNQWRALADELGKHTWHVKDTWRRIKLPNLKKGHWSQEEYQKLFDLVNTDLQLKVSEEKRSKHGMLRDNICWTAISDSLSSRNQATCCLKWYKQMTSPMVAEGIWSDSDDYRLLSELYSLDATCLEDVEWDDLIENRPGDVCRKRWSQMVLHIGHHGNKSFAEQVEVLAQRYCPHLLEARETWDNKPRVP